MVVKERGSGGWKGESVCILDKGENKNKIILMLENY